MVMRASYRVIGIIQVHVDGQWYERPIRSIARAESAEQAKTQTLLDYEAIEGVQVRWHRPDYVQCQRRG